MYNKSKYGNLLTIILIIAIVSIAGILGIVGYRIYRAYYINIGATEAATVFEGTLNNGSENNGISNTIENNTINGIAGVDESLITTETTTSAAVRTKYKGFDVIGTIQIPTIELKYPILEQLTKKSLETSVALLYTSNGINNAGNTVIIGHNYKNGTMFSKVKNLKNGDIIYITSESGEKVKYTVYDVYRTSGNDSTYMTRNTNGKREISLSTCTDDSKARTIVLAKEE